MHVGRYFRKRRPAGSDDKLPDNPRGTPRDGASRITRLYLKLGPCSLVFTLICIVWLAWRVSTKPSRIGYPCSQFALGQIALFLGSASIPFAGLVHAFISHLRRREYLKTGRLALVVVVVFGCFAGYQGYQEHLLRQRGSGTILASTMAGSPLTPPWGAAEPGQAFSFPQSVNGQAVVSISHDPQISYGTAAPPYDPADNLAYDFVWETVLRLGLGDDESPLGDLIHNGDTVLIKPNWVDYGEGVYTRPEVVWPLVDMAVAAGAAEVCIGDGGGDFDTTVAVMDSGNYTAMAEALDDANPSVDIEAFNLNNIDHGWQWISLSGNSSFASSNYTHAQLGTGSDTLFEHDYYMATDDNDVSPNGDVLGWYAVSDKLLKADVVINVSKMKTHQEMMATMAVKNYVGLTMASTYDYGGYVYRIAHHHNPIEDNYFNNDIFWRAILDMHKIVLYADKDGVLQPIQQRSELNVVDAIQAMERSQHHEYGGGGLTYDRHVLMAGVDPVALDAVGCRIMGYDYREIPSIANAATDSVHPIGINDPEDILIVGDAIDSSISHVFLYNENWSDDADALDIEDFDPPVINAIDRTGNTVTADISDAQSAYLVYEYGGYPQAVKMGNTGDAYTGTVPETVTSYQVVAQDEYFNTDSDEPSFTSVTITDNGATGLDFGQITPNDELQPEAAVPSVTIIAGSESGDIAIYIMGEDFEGPGTIPIDNAYYHDSDNVSDASPVPGTLSDTGWRLGPSENISIFHWLKVPVGTPAGDYSSTFTYETQSL